MGFGYDTAFMFAEVNAEKFYWMHNGSELKFVSRDPKSIGQLISTKRPGRTLGKLNEDRMDISLDYKPNEGVKFFLKYSRIHSSQGLAEGLTRP